MADFYESEAGEAVAGASRDLSDVTMEEALSFPPDPARPSWMLTRFPVSMEEFRQLSDAATQPEPAPAAAEVVEAQADTEGEAELIEFPEDATAVAPVTAAPGVTSSFDGITQTAFQPPDNTIAVGPSDVL